MKHIVSRVIIVAKLALQIWSTEVQGLNDMQLFFMEVISHKDFQHFQGMFFDIFCSDF